MNILLMFLTILSAITLVGCNNNIGGGNETPPIVEKIDITGIKFENKTVEYDGKSHSIEITGNLPQGVTVSYTNNGQTEVGQYSIIATFTDSTGKYNVPNPMSAILTIEGPKVVENSVKIKSIKATETAVEPAVAKLSTRTKLNSKVAEEDVNYIIITRPQTDITFTITLDNPEAYAIDALRVYCDDENAQIQVDGEYKPIAQESDATRVINWSSEDPYTKTYNIRTTSEDAINSFKVVDVRLAGHDKFQSKETNSTDLGNNELHIYKMDEDAYTLNVIENTFDYIKFNFNIKDEYKDIISNIRVDGLEMDEELGYWMLNESKTVNVSYDYYLEEYELKVSRKDSVEVEIITFRTSERFVSSFDRDKLISSSFNIILNGTSGSLPYPISISTEIVDWSDGSQSQKVAFMFAFELNCDFEIYYDDINLNKVNTYSGYGGYYEYPDKPDELAYFHFYEFEYITFNLDEYLDLSDYFGCTYYGHRDNELDFGYQCGNEDCPGNYRNCQASSIEEIYNFVNHFTIIINDEKYKFSVSIYEDSDKNQDFRQIIGLIEVEE